MIRVKFRVRVKVMIGVRIWVKVRVRVTDVPWVGIAMLMQSPRMGQLSMVMACPFPGG